MKKLLLILISVMISLSAWSQNLQDVVYLKNGSIIRGTLIEQVPSIKIKTMDGSIWVFETEDIERITSELKTDNTANYSDDTYIKKELMENYNRQSSQKNDELSRGFRVMADFAYMQRTNQDVCSGISFAGVFGFQITPNIFAGIGVADQAYIDYYYYGTYSYEPEVYVQLPMFADLRYDFSPGRFSPMANIRMGYAVSGDLYNDYQGLYINPAVGYRMGKLTLSLGADLVRLREPWVIGQYSSNGNYSETEIFWQSTVQFKIQMEWGGRM